MDTKKLSGSLKVAILIEALDASAAQAVIDSFSEEEKQLVNKLRPQVGSVSAELIEKVAQEFIEKAARNHSGSRPALTVGEKGKEGGKSGHDGKETKPAIRNLKAIQSLSSDQLFQLIKDEHPQTIAIVAAHLQSKSASDVLARLPDELKADVALRIASLDKVVAEMVEEIDRIFEDMIQNEEDAKTQEAGGVEHLAEILNQIDGALAEKIIDEIEATDPPLAEKIRRRMFVFDDLVLVDDKGLQKVLRSVESQEMALALKAASEDVRQKIFRNMSSRAAEILQEEIESTGAVRMKDVADAQQRITAIVQEMERKGEVVISGRGGEQFIG
jgi:flagellar motor switch protein FliG